MRRETAPDIHEPPHVDIRVDDIPPAYTHINIHNTQRVYMSLGRSALGTNLDQSSIHRSNGRPPWKQQAFPFPCQSSFRTLCRISLLDTTLRANRFFDFCNIRSVRFLQWLLVQDATPQNQTPRSVTNSVFLFCCLRA